jgi:Response regulator receiver domain
LPVWQLQACRPSGRLGTSAEPSCFMREADGFCRGTTETPNYLNLLRSSGVGSFMGEPGMPMIAVLIVEDEHLIRMGAVSIFEDAGFEVHEAGSADAAISILELHQEIRLVFTDINMPGTMDGLNSHTMSVDVGHQ